MTSGQKVLGTLFTLFVITSGCGAVSQTPHRTPKAPVASDTVVQSLPGPSAVVPPDKSAAVAAALVAADERNVAATAASERVSGEITLNKSEIFGRTFLYGFDLQYSSTGDVGKSLLNQSEALGHVPAVFRQVGDRLQLVADNGHLFESVVNHPETLINEYHIIHEDSAKLTITMNKPGLLIHKSVNGKEAAAPISTWLRSLEFVAEGNYILQESALMLENGEVQTYMESLFPRETLVPEGYVAIEDNADVNPKAERFKFLNNEEVFVQRKLSNGVPVREKTAFANRFHLKTVTSTIDWYVTPNTPDELMKEMRSGVEGWNRYFRDQLGRDVVFFKGRLPAGVRLGDPRYNVINFDTVAMAGAAYESQASDPLTGIQSHSLIYMPYAWYNIAAKLIAAREVPEEELSGKELLSRLSPKSPSVLFGKDRSVLTCARLASDVSSGPLQSALALATTDEARLKVVEDFGRRVFISTLFHEMGHALGLNHNFKGSLSFDGEQPKSDTNPTSYTVMDYNYYQHEIDLVKVIGDSDGPRMEYDRQMISVLYNDGKDVKDTDRVIHACTDDDADEVAGGVDPNCIRYDAEKNPLFGLEHAVKRLIDPSGAYGIEKQTLTASLGVHGDLLLTKLTSVEATADAAAATKLVEKAAAEMGLVVGYYISEGAQSLRVNLSLNSVALRAWRVDPKDEGQDMPETDRRGRYQDLLELALNMNDLPVAAKEAIKGIKERVAATVQGASRFGSDAERTALVEKFSNLIDKQLSDATTAGFAKLKTTLAGKLNTGEATAAFASFVHKGRTAEQVAVAQLKSMVLSQLSAENIGTAAQQKARVDAVKSLATFAKLGTDYTEELTAVKGELTSIRNTARQAGKQETVDHVRALLKELVTI